MKKSNNQNFVLEVFWLIVAVLTIITGIYNTFTNGFEEAYMFFIMGVLALLLYLARRTLRIKNNKM